MAGIGLVSPGVKVREVDLTVGRIDSISDQTGAIVGPFERGPVLEPLLIENEQDMIELFGKPISSDRQYEYWYTAANYLQYGGILRVVRADGASLNNANVGGIGTSGDSGYDGVGITSNTSLKIKSFDDYQNNHEDATNFRVAARNPGSYANGMKVAYIDGAADQRLTITADITAAGDGSTISGSMTGNSVIQVGAAVTQAISGSFVGVGTTGELDGYLQGIVTGVGNSTIDVKVVNRVSAAGTIFPVKYSENGKFQFNVGAATTNNVSSGFSMAVLPSSGISILGTSSSIAAPAAGLATAVSVTQADDWYDNQFIQLKNGALQWKEIAEKPGTSGYAAARNSTNDELHIVVIDDSGKISGTSGAILEKFTFLSKADDAVDSFGSKIYYKDFIAENSDNIFVGLSTGEGSIASGIITAFTPTKKNSETWSQDAQDTKFNFIGNKLYELQAGADYSGIGTAETIGGYSCSLGSIMEGYEIFENEAEYAINFLLQGPGIVGNEQESQAKANKLIAIAEARKDCLAVISPNRETVVNVTKASTQTDNVVRFYDPITSSSFAVFDSGYKYQFDRFNNKFQFMPLNGDIAGLMARTSEEQFPWFSPAGSQRGNILNAVKLAYNPNKVQRDTLYTKRINPVIFSPGAGFVLFGDKTGLAIASAFDRINVRRLFLNLEARIEVAARTQLFEFNDEITRANFRNIVEPFLRGVQAKRGITDFLVICDETNNTPDVIDANEFKCDIFIKPARSINFIGLTFVATRTGVSFSEVAGRV